MNTDSRRKASAAYHAKRTSEGLKKVTLWLTPEARFKLDALKAAHGSKDAAVNAALAAYTGRASAAAAPSPDPRAAALKAGQDRIKAQFASDAERLTLAKYANQPKPEPFKTRLKGEWTPPGGKKR